MLTPYQINSSLSRQIDLASFFASVMVLFIHSSLAMIPRTSSYLFVESLVGDGLCRIAVPFFFLRSGFFFFLNIVQLKIVSTKILRRCKTLLVPYILWSILGLLFLFIVSHISFTRSFIVRDLPWDSISNIANHIITDPINYQLWFLRDLLLVIVISPIVFLAIHFLSWIPFFVLLFMYIISLFSFPFFYSSSSLFFFVAGATMAMKNPQIIEFSPERSTIISLSLVFLFLLFYTAAAKSYSLPNIAWLNRVSPIVGLAVFWWLIRRFSSMFSVLSSSVISLSFFIYLLHEPFLTFVKKLAISILPCTHYQMFILYFSLPLFILLICISIGLLLKAHFPSLYSLLVGSR